MPIKFQADADLDHNIIRGLKLRHPDVDFRTAVQANLTGVEDPEVLRRSAAAGRLLVSHDVQTMPRHFGQFIQESTSAGLILIPQTYPLRLAIEDLSLVWTASKADEWTDVLVRLPF